MKMLDYTPSPVDTASVELSPELQSLAEQLARNVHEVWAVGRAAEGWTYGPERNDALKTHPGMVPYECLSEAEKDYDRRTSQQTIRFILLNGFSIKKTI